MPPIITTNAYQFKISLRGAKPPVWRRVLIPDSFTLHDLHLAIQTAFDWCNYHLYNFQVKKPWIEKIKDGKRELEVRHNTTVICDISQWDELEGELDSRKAKLKEWVKEGDRMIYTYDFGDNWENDIVCEKKVDNYPFSYPQCLKATGFAPAEDCGGIWGWKKILATLKNFDPKDLEHQELREWLLGMLPDFNELDDLKDFDPKLVDLAGINERLESYNDLDVEGEN